MKRNRNQKESPVRAWDVFSRTGYYYGEVDARTSAEACEKAWEKYDSSRELYDALGASPMPKGIHARLAK